MKKKSTHPVDGNKWLQLSSLSVAMLLLPNPAPAEDRVVIEGGPAEIQISDKDGRPETVDPANNQVGEPAAILPPTPNAVTIRPVSTSDVEVLVPVKRANMSGKTITDLRPAPTVTPTPKQISAEASKRMSEIKRELRIAESATTARAIFKADELFSAKSPVIEDAAKPTLKMLAEFMELSPKAAASVSYTYVATKESESDARLRAFALVDYLSRMAGATSTEFAVMDPKPVAVEPPKASTSGQFITTAEPLIEITLK